MQIRMCKSCSIIRVGVVVVVVVLIQTTMAAQSIDEAIRTIAGRLETEQIVEGVDSGSWPDEAAFTGSIVAGMVGAYELTCEESFRTSAELGGDYILFVSQGNFFGDEALALTRLSQTALDPGGNKWRTAIADFYLAVNNGGTDDYVSAFGSFERSAAVFHLANHVVAAHYVEAEDIHIWRQGLIDSLSRIDDTCDFPVLALGAATWALAQTGALDETLIAASGQGVAYWDAKTLSDLPGLLRGHQAPDGRPGAGSFYWQFGHADDNHGYTEDTIFATRGLLASSRIGPDPNLKSAIATARAALLGSIGDNGKVSEHLWQDGLSYYSYAGEMLEVLSEMVVAGDLDSDGDVESDDLTLLVTLLIESWNASDCSRSCWCNGADLDRSGQVDGEDFQIMASMWLELDAGQEVSGSE